MSVDVIRMFYVFIFKINLPIGAAVLAVKLGLQIINVVKGIYDSSPVKTLITSADMYFLKKVLDNSNVIIEAEKETKE